MTDTTALPALYAEVLHFYARQMQALDNGDFVAYAATFVPDGRFTHTPTLPAAQGREEIVSSLADFHTRFVDDPVQRRHYFDHVIVDRVPDDTLRCTSYALVLTTRPGGALAVGPSCVVTDVLTRTPDGLRAISRYVDHDRDAFPTLPTVGRNGQAGPAHTGDAR